MPKYSRTVDSTVELPDLGLVVHFGDVVEIPADFFTDADHALASGFTPVGVAKATSAPSVTPPASQTANPVATVTENKE